MNDPSAIDRRHHSELQPIRTRPHNPYTPQRRPSRQGSIASAISTPSLPSPSIVAARAYFLESTTPIGPNTDAQQRRRSLIEGQRFPRRHSVLSTPKASAVQLESFSFAEGCHDLHTVPETEETVTQIKVEKCSDVSMGGVDEVDEVTPPRRNSDMLCGISQEVLRQVLFQYTHDHLRDWGYAYLGNLATADAFVNAVSIRRPSMFVGKGEGLEVRTNTDLTIIRARVVPNGKDRKPFLIQRKFDIDELRRSIPKLPSQPGNIERGPVLRRSSRNRRSSTQATTEIRRKDNVGIKKNESSLSLGKGSLPIHIEYALHYLPVLGALMLSGHVRKGDSIDLPIPKPEAWRDVLTYIYTDRGVLTSGMKENICFLAGHA